MSRTVSATLKPLWRRRSGDVLPSKTPDKPSRQAVPRKQQEHVSTSRSHFGDVARATSCRRGLSALDILDAGVRPAQSTRAGGLRWRLGTARRDSSPKRLLDTVSRDGFLGTSFSGRLSRDGLSGRLLAPAPQDGLSRRLLENGISGPLFKLATRAGFYLASGKGFTGRNLEAAFQDGISRVETASRDGFSRQRWTEKERQSHTNTRTHTRHSHTNTSSLPGRKAPYSPPPPSRSCWRTSRQTCGAQCARWPPAAAPRPSSAGSASRSRPSVPAAPATPPPPPPCAPGSERLRGDELLFSDLSARAVITNILGSLLPSNFTKRSGPRPWRTDVAKVLIESSLRLVQQPREHAPGCVR